MALFTIPWTEPCLVSLCSPLPFSVTAPCKTHPSPDEGQCWDENKHKCHVCKVNLSILSYPSSVSPSFHLISLSYFRKPTSRTSFMYLFGLIAF